MNLEDLRAVQVDERGTDSLQPLPSNFYGQAADYLADLRERRDRLADRADDPFDSPEVRRLTDELETAEEVIEAIYERRLSKVVKRASLAATGISIDETGLTDEEQTLFGDIVERIEANRSAVLDVLEEGSAGGGPDPPTGSDRRAGEPDASSAGSEPGPTPDRQSAAGTSAGGEPEPDGGGVAAVAQEPVAEPATDGADRLTVRITADVGEIYGVDDRVYTLGEEDVVTLPAANAKPLLNRGAAHRVE